LLGFSRPLGSSILLASPPKNNFPTYRDREEKERSLAAAAYLYQSAHIVRGLRAEFKIPSHKLVQLLVQPASFWSFADQLAFASLVKAETIETVSSPPKGTAGVITSLGEFFIPLLGVDIISERRRLLGEINRAEVEISKARSKLENTGFISHAPGHVVNEYRVREANWKKKKEILHGYLSSIK
jgi:valyl-tRNA synthetase